MSEKLLSPKDGFIFDSSKLIKSLHPAVGLLRVNNFNIYYFGQLIPKKKKETFTKKNKKYERTVQRDTFCLISDNADFVEVDNEFCKSRNVSFKDSSLLPKRWSLKEIDEFTGWQGDLSKHYKVITPLEMFEKVRGLYKKYLFLLQEESYDVHVLWDIGTYFYSLFEAYPYYELEGLPGCGKSKLMKLSSLLSFNGQIFTNPTPSTIFRYVQAVRPTLYIDEAEKLYRYDRGKKESGEIVELLNAGWQRGSNDIPRMEKNSSGNWEMKTFDPFCPKMIASVKGIPQGEPLKERCIPEIMVKSPKGDTRGDLEITESEEIIRIRDSLYAFALRNWKLVHAYYCGEKGLVLEKEFSLSNRDWQIWKPLLVLAKLISSSLYKRVGRFAEEITGKRNIVLDEDSWDYKIVNVLSDLVVEESAQFYSSRYIREKVHEQFEVADRKPSQKYISGYLNKIGFKKFHVHTREGNGYSFSKLDVDFILKTQNLKNPSQASHSSPSSILYIKEERISEGCIKNDVNDVNVSCEGLKDLKDVKDYGGMGGEIQLPCSRCGNSPCAEFNDHKPICKECLEKK